MFPSLEDSCSQHFKFVDLIVCGETVIRNNIDNKPLQLDSYDALSDLAVNILDPITANFLRPTITYGFASANLIKLKPKPTTPSIDQHCAYELNTRGKLINKRGGAAVDIRVDGLDALSCAKWIRSNLTFDRLYFYGKDSSLHISYNQHNSGLAYQLLRNPQTGRLYPKVLKP